MVGGFGTFAAGGGGGFDVSTHPRARGGGTTTGFGTVAAVGGGTATGEESGAMWSTSLNAVKDVLEVYRQEEEDKKKTNKFYKRRRKGEQMQYVIWKSTFCKQNILKCILSGAISSSEFNETP